VVYSGVDKRRKVVCKLVFCICWPIGKRYASISTALAIVVRKAPIMIWAALFCIGARRRAILDWLL
jgi:hypothetical protein